MDHMLITHNVLRWFVLLFGLYAITKSARGLLKNQDYTAKHNRASVLFVMTIHLQALLGLVLYFSNNWHNNISQAFEDMSNNYIRFYAIEHIFGMLLAVVLIQIGRTKSKKATDTRSKHKYAFKYFLIGMFIILATIPWPFRETLGRSLWPF